MGNDELFKKRKDQGKLKRKAEERTQRESLWIIYEGETEESYIKSLDLDTKKFRYSRSNHLGTISRELGEIHDTAKHIFVFLDSDIHKKNDIDNFLQKIKGYQKVSTIICSPCFEFWFILHFEKTTKCFIGNGQKITADDECTKHLKKLLKKHGETYKKGILSPQIIEILRRRYSQAIESLKAICKDLPYSENTILNFFNYFDN